MGPPDEERLRRLYEAARLYYEENLNKTTIGHQMSVSNTQVTRYLKEAMQHGIVKLTLVPPRVTSLEMRFRTSFDCLREVKIIRTGGSVHSQIRNLGQAAAEYFDFAISKLEAEEPGRRVRVGISGGNTMYEVINALPRRTRNIDIYPTALIGRGPFIPENVDPMVLINTLWDKCGRSSGSAYYVTVPPFDRSRSIRSIVTDIEKMKRWPKVKQVWEGMQKLDLLFAGIGSFRTRSHATLLSLLEDIGISRSVLEREGIIGDISYSMFDVNGNQRQPRKAKSDLFITFGIRQLQAMAKEYPKRRVVLVAGDGKEEVIAAALRGNTCNVLITDETTAEKVLAHRDPLQTRTATAGIVASS